MRKMQLTLNGRYCAWIHEELRDRHYRYTDEAAIPLVVMDRVESLVLDRINSLVDDTYTPMYASYVPSVSRTALLSASAMEETVTFEPA